jgi:hypothetical protein
MFQNIMGETEFFPLIFNFDICGFEIHGTFVVRINRINRGLPVYSLLMPVGIILIIIWYLFLMVSVRCMIPLSYLTYMFL